MGSAMRDIGEDIEEFKHQGALALAAGNKAALRQLFTRWYVALRARHREDGLEVVVVMREALREVFLAQARKIEDGWFDDL